MSTTAQLTDELEESRDDLIAMLQHVPAMRLRRRSTSGDWSILENVRHLLYAEELHILRALAPGFSWTPLGLPTNGTVKRNGAGMASSDDLGEVIDAWAATHARAQAAVRDAPDDEATQRMLERTLRHLRVHTRTIRRLLEEAEG
jgi:hypothetical protein